MATIAISDLSMAGSEFFADSEGYMGELSEQELREMQGGGTPACWLAAGAVFAVAAVAGWAYSEFS